MAFGPARWLRLATDEVPAVKYATGVVGIAAAIAIVRGLLGDVSLAGMVPVIIGAVICMTVLLIFAKAVASPHIGNSAALIVFFWAVCIFVITLMAFTITAIAFAWPGKWAEIILPHEAVRSSLSDRITGGSEPSDTNQLSLSGYVYYEELNGRATDDGVFVLRGTSEAPPYSTIRQGTILEAVSTARVRAGPTMSDRIVGEIDGQHCVVVLSPPTLPQPALETATSGGRLSVRGASCLQ